MVKLSIQAIVPGKSARGSDYARDIERALQRHQEGTRQDLKATTRTWETVVVFRIKIERKRGELVITASTNSKVYGWVNDGTRAHIIRPKKAAFLQFQSGYRAKTAPGVIGSRSGGAPGDTVRTRLVLHPGTEARNFTEVIARKRQKLLQSEIQTAINRTGRRVR